jgi:hypothetical protein
MSKSMTNGGSRLAVVFGAVASVILSGIVLTLRADEQSSRGAKPTGLAKELMGTWILVGTPDKIGEVPKSGGRLKFITGKHWTVTQADPDTGKVIFHHGGTYTLDGDKYVETVDYANESTADLIKKSLEFKVKVEGDTLTQIGVGNPFTEVWKRAK